MPPPGRRRRGGVVWPLILIFLGAVLLLENTGYLPPNFWVNLWRLWPLVLVLIGLELLLAGRIPWLALAGVATIVLVVGAAVMTANIGPGGAAVEAAPFTTTTDLGGATQAAITIRFGAGQLAIAPVVNPDPNQLASMTYAGPAQLAPTAAYVVSPDGIGQLEYQQGGGRSGPPFNPFRGGGSNARPRLELSLNPDVPITSLNVQAGAADAHLDLSSLKVSAIDVSVGAASTWLRFPEAAGTTTAHLSGGASSITLEIPEGVAAQIQHHGGLSTITVDQSRFPAAGDNVFRSPNYATASNRLDLSIDTGMTSIQVT